MLNRLTLFLTGIMTIYILYPNKELIVQIVMILILFLAMRLAYTWGKQDGLYRGRNEMLESHRETK